MSNQMHVIVWSVLRCSLHVIVWSVLRYSLFNIDKSQWNRSVIWYYTLEKCYTIIWGNNIYMGRINELPIGWNWHEMCLCLLPNEIRPYLGQTFTSMPSGIVEVQNRSLGGHFPKSAFALWQVWMNNCIFFSIPTNYSNNDPSKTYRY